jgi:hypothetical protein
MIRRSDMTPVAAPAAGDDTWTAAVAQAAALTHRQVLVFERSRWPTGAGLVRTAFWLRDDVPAELRGLEAPGRPDPRPILSGEDVDLAEHAAADAEWREQAAEWRAARLAWLAKQAGR